MDAGVRQATNGRGGLNEPAAALDVAASLLISASIAGRG
jgi:hypothetical protein